jgi:hypothetical protein
MPPAPERLARLRSVLANVPMESSTSFRTHPPVKDQFPFPSIAPKRCKFYTRRAPALSDSKTVCLTRLRRTTVNLIVEAPRLSVGCSRGIGRWVRLFCSVSHSSGRFHNHEISYVPGERRVLASLLPSLIALDIIL